MQAAALYSCAQSWTSVGVALPFSKSSTHPFPNPLRIRQSNMHTMALETITLTAGQYLYVILPPNDIITIGFWFQVTSGLNVHFMLLNQTGFDQFKLRNGFQYLLEYSIMNSTTGLKQAAPFRNTQTLYFVQSAAGFGASTLNQVVQVLGGAGGCTLTCNSHGLCSPAGCDCIPGWIGSQCETPVCNPSCIGVNSFCNAPNKCSCRSGWQGTSCDVPICTTGGGCGYFGTCVAPDTCRCTAGWSGNNCSVPVCDTPVCNSATSKCTSPNKCSCLAGWSGADCSTPICSVSCGTNGTCIAPNQCVCANGWTGSDVGCGIQMGPAKSCAVGGIGSDLFCCKIKMLYDFSGSRVWVFSLNILGFGKYPICLENNAANTVTAADNLAKINWVGGLMTKYGCWGGEIASAPGSGVVVAGSAKEYEAEAVSFSCIVSFPVDGNWTEFVPSGPCTTSGTQLMTRNCSNPAPLRGGKNCLGDSSYASTSCKPYCRDCDVTRGECISDNVCTCSDHATGLNCRTSLCSTQVAGEDRWIQIADPPLYPGRYSRCYDVCLVPVPVNGKRGDCDIYLKQYETCNIVCDAGFTLVGDPTYCDDVLNLDKTSYVYKATQQKCLNGQELKIYNEQQAAAKGPSIESGSSKMALWLIVVIAVAGFIVLIAIIFSAALYVKRKRNESNSFQPPGPLSPLGTQQKNYVPTAAVTMPISPSLFNHEASTQDVELQIVHQYIAQPQITQTTPAVIIHTQGV
jgi:hypothetical protein